MRCAHIKSVLLAVLAVVAVMTPAGADSYASAISAYRRANGLSAVVSDSRLNGLAMNQARAMSASGQVNHTAAGNFNVRVAKLGRKIAAENVAAGFLTFPETLKQWENSAGHRENLLIPGAKKVGVASVSNPASPYRKFWAMIITD